MCVCVCVVRGVSYAPAPRRDSAHVGVCDNAVYREFSHLLHNPIQRVQTDVLYSLRHPEVVLCAS